MSDVIRLLPDSVANQIAAGEVIQRPASVIKELVENAVDAGAQTINVLVVDAGRTSIQVIDDGCGMSETDARLAFERHATSKIRQANDLFSLHTMGFRGEALPSIAAVAQVEVRTRRKDNEIGTCLMLSASRVESQEPCACATGCSITVSNLFFNVPARRKFLKSNATELNNILTAFERIVLVYPDINFTLHSNGQELINLKAGSLKQRIADIYGRRYGQDLIPVNVDTELCRISGFTAKPETARKKGAHEYFFVNGRFMKHAYFHKAVLQAYDRLIPDASRVPYFIYFNVDPATIDVNIHPTKTEIKFENEQTIWQILSAAVKEAIGKFCEVPSIEFDTEGRPDIPVFNPADDTPHAPQLSFNPAYNPFASTSSHAAAGAQRSGGAMSSRRSSRDWETLYEAAFTEKGVPEESSLFEEASSPGALLQEKSPAHYQYKGCYIMTAVKSGLMIIDQYRASVRIMYERYLAQMADRTAVPQRVLFPEAVQFSPAEAALLQQLLPELTTMGFELSDLGGGSFAVNAVPAGVDGDPTTLVRHLVDDAAEHDGTILQNHTDSLALALARHTAVTHGQVLSNEEMETIVNQLFSCSDVNHTPDGRTILCILPQHDIEHLLG